MWPSKTQYHQFRVLLRLAVERDGCECRLRRDDATAPVARHLGPPIVRDAVEDRLPLAGSAEHARASGGVRRQSRDRGAPLGDPSRVASRARLGWGWGSGSGEDEG